MIYKNIETNQLYIVTQDRDYYYTEDSDGNIEKYTRLPNPFEKVYKFMPYVCIKPWLPELPFDFISSKSVVYVNKDGSIGITFMGNAKEYKEGYELGKNDKWDKFVKNL